MDDLIEALTIFRKYGNPSHPVFCGHDQIFINVPTRPSEMTPEDAERLKMLSFTHDGDMGWYSYRFGSC